MKKMELSKKDQDLLKVLLSQAFLWTNRGPKNAYEEFIANNLKGWDSEEYWYKYIEKEIRQFEIFVKINEADEENEDGQATLKILIRDLCGKESDCNYLVDQDGDAYTDEGITNHPLYLFLTMQEEKKAMCESLGATSEPTQSTRQRGRL